MGLLPILLLLAAAMNAKPGIFENPILRGFHPDPSVVRVGEDYYLVNSTFEYFPGLPIHHSKDLVHWRQIGNVLTRPSQNPLKGATDFGGQYAPTIRHHQGRFYVTCTNMTGPGSFIVTATDPAGPWSEPSWLGNHEMDGSMFFDDDGKAYYTKFAGKDGGGDGGEHSGISQAEFDPETLKITTPFRMVYNNLKEPWNEGPHLYKIKGRYYLMLAEGGTGDRHQEVIGRSDSPWGPFEPCPHNPILTHRGFPSSPIQATGHGDLVEAHDGSWWMVFLAVRPQRGVSVLGRETFLAPVQWDNGWPVVNKDGRVALTMEAPKLKPHPFPPAPVRQDFKSKALGPEWIHVRNIDPASLSLSERPGHLRLRAVKDGLNSQHEQPAFAGRRQRAFRFSARTRMEFSPGQDGEEAGLVVRSNDHNHYEVGLEQAGGRRQVFVRNTTKGSTVSLVQAPFQGDAIHLELAGDEEQYQFAWSRDGKTWERLGASPAADLSKEKAGGFTGTAVGLYATANGKASQAHADFDWFEMEDGRAPAPQAILARPTQTPVPQRAEWRIAAGREAPAGIDGNLWLPDQAHDGGQVAQTSGAIQGGGTEAYLFQSERWEREFSYSLPVPPGRYRLRLLFAETYLDGAGQRVFSVLVNGVPRIEHLDILAQAGGKHRALVKELRGIEPGPDGRVKVGFKASVQNAKVCALELLPEVEP